MVPEIIYQLDKTVKNCYEKYFSNSGFVISTKNCKFEDNLAVFSYRFSHPSKEIRILIRFKVREHNNFTIYIEYENFSKITFSKTFDSRYDGENFLESGMELIVRILKDFSEGCVKLW